MAEQQQVSAAPPPYSSATNFASTLREKMQNKNANFFNDCMAQLKVEIENNADSKTMSSAVRWHSGWFEKQDFSLLTGKFKVDLTKWADTQGFSMQTRTACNCSAGPYHCVQKGGDHGITFTF